MNQINQLGNVMQVNEKRNWQTPELIDMIKLEKTAGGTNVGNTELHCTYPGISSLLSTFYLPTTSGGVVSTNNCD